MSALFDALAESLHADRSIVVATVIAGPHLGNKMLIWPDGRTLGSLDSPILDRAAQEQAETQLAQQASSRFTVVHDALPAPVELFLDVHVPSPRLVIVGAVHIAIPLVTFANALGFRTLVVDARSAFATPDRFGHADQLIIRWPADVLADLDLNESTYVVTLTHDEKLDNPALVVALNRPVRYIGALGSRRTHAKRVDALKAEGVTDEQLARIHAPIGLDLGGRKPEEIAVSIIAEIVQVRNNRSG